MTDTRLSRRTILAGTGAATAATICMPAVLRAATTEIVHWSWLAASDGEVWQKMIDGFNAANKDKGMTIRMEIIPEEQYTTKVLAAVASGKGPDFGWGTAGKGAALARDEVTVPLDDLAKKAGLDLGEDLGDLLLLLPERVRRGSRPRCVAGALEP